MSAAGAAPYRWYVFAWAAITAGAVVPLIVLGGLVTSLRAGMADSEPLRSPLYMVRHSWRQLAEEQGLNHVIEHSHRFAGWIVGAMSIVMALLLLALDSRSGMKALGVIGLVGISVQGVLGIFRVALNDAGLGLELAMVHGVLGPLVFTLFVAIALMTSRSWIEGGKFAVEEAARFRKVSRLTILMIILQLIAGVLLRQLGDDIGFKLLLFIHLFLALAVVAHVVMLWVRVGRWREAPAVIARPVQVALILMGVQVLLGMATWVYGGGVGANTQALSAVPTELAISATAHVAIGALLLAAAVVIAFRAARHLQPMAGGTA